MGWLDEKYKEKKKSVGKTVDKTKGKVGTAVHKTKREVAKRKDVARGIIEKHKKQPGRVLFDPGTQSELLWEGAKLGAPTDQTQMEKLAEPVEKTKKRIKKAGEQLKEQMPDKEALTGERAKRHKAQERERKLGDILAMDEKTSATDKLQIRKPGEKGTAEPSVRPTAKIKDIQPELIPTDAVADVTAGKAGKIEAERIARGDVADVTTTAVTPAEAAQMRREDVRDVQSGQLGLSEFRGTQAELAAALQAQARGEAPSIAEMQAKRTGERALAQQLAMAAGATGSQAALARRTAARQQAQIGADIAATAAQARLQEQRQAQEQLGQVAAEARQQDTAKEIQQQEADLRADLANQGVDLDVFKTNLESENRVALANLGARQADREAKLRADLANQGVDLDIVKQNAAAGNAAALANLKAETADLDRELKAAMGNQAVEFDIIKTNAAAKNTAALANVDAALRKIGLDDDMKRAYMQNELGLSKLEVDAAIAKDRMATDVKIAKAKIAGGIMEAEIEAEADAAAGGLGALGTAASAYFSDIKLKQNIVNSEDRLTDFLNKLDAYDYDYKDEKHGKGRQTSVMAQDLEKSEIGKKAVIETDEGKMVDYTKLLPELLAATAQTHKKVTKLEEALLAKKKNK